MSDFKLLRVLNETILEDRYHTEVLEGNIARISEATQLDVKFIAESASSVLYQTEVDVREGGEINSSKLEKALALLLLIDEDVREAFNINDRKIDIINKHVDKDERVDRFLSNLRNHPSVSGIIDKLLASVRENKEAFVKKLAKARLFFDRI